MVLQDADRDRFSRQISERATRQGCGKRVSLALPAFSCCVRLEARVNDGEKKKKSINKRSSRDI